MSNKIPVSVIIPAKNEEANLSACLASLQQADEIFVVDSQSTDKSAEIATSYGAKVVQFYFNGRWPKKKNWSLDNLPFRNEWILIVDCDERITPELWDEIAVSIQNDQQSQFNGFYLNRRVFFMGKWIRHGGKYPDWNLRLFKHKLGRYENLNTEEIRNTGDNEVHEHVILKGEVGYLKNDMLHEDFRDLFHWLERHNRYSNWEARVYYNILLRKDDDGTIGASLFGDAVQRKRFLKKIWVRLPFKPLLRFILFYIIQRGFLDGKAGYIYGRLLSQYEYQIGVKLYELRSCNGQLNTAKKPTKTAPKFQQQEAETAI
ncbi:glycosyl transferase family protein [Rivularia sp. IAM M-261]|nr:glycosyl transferase family protein [Calothrix sp. PCC 7716]GJD20599.1 glycosyl transferase family protein [Rivularia sp. IAM M-261]